MLLENERSKLIMFRRMHEAAPVNWHIYCILYLREDHFYHFVLWSINRFRLCIYGVENLVSARRGLAGGAYVCVLLWRLLLLMIVGAVWRERWTHSLFSQWRELLSLSISLLRVNGGVCARSLCRGWERSIHAVPASHRPPQDTYSVVTQAIIYATHKVTQLNTMLTIQKPN